MSAFPSSYLSLCCFSCNFKRSPCSTFLWILWRLRRFNLHITWAPLALYETLYKYVNIIYVGTRSWMKVIQCTFFPKSLSFWKILNKEIIYISRLYFTLIYYSLQLYVLLMGSKIGKIWMILVCIAYSLASKDSWEISINSPIFFFVLRLIHHLSRNPFSLFQHIVIKKKKDIKKMCTHGVAVSFPGFCHHNRQMDFTSDRCRYATFQCLFKYIWRHKPRTQNKGL